MRLKNKVALITGGGSGIGRETCLLFAKEGAKVVVVDLDKSTGRATAKDIVKENGEAVFFRADISNPLDRRWKESWRWPVSDRCSHWQKGNS